MTDPEAEDRARITSQCRPFLRPVKLAVVALPILDENGDKTGQAMYVPTHFCLN